MSSDNSKSSDATGGIRRRIVSNAAALAVGGVIAQGCMVAVEAIIARRLGEVGYGIFSTAYAFGLFGMFVVDMGMSWKLIQDASRDQRSTPLLLGTTLATRGLLAIVVYPVMAVGFGAFGLGSEANGFFAVLFLYVLLMCVQNALTAVNSAEQRMHVSAAFQAATPALILGLVIGITSVDPSLNMVGAAFVAGSVIVTGVWSWLMFRRIRPIVNLRESPRILRESYLYAITGILLHGSLRLELLLLSVFRPMGEVGLFAAADRFADLGLKVAVMGARVVAPVLFQQSLGNPAVFQLSCRRTLRGAAVLGVGAALVLALAAAWVVPIVFGSQFASAGPILAILAISLALRFMNQAAQIVLTSSDHHGRRTVGQASGVGAAVVANIAVIPAMGAMGAACARLVGDVVQLVILLTSSALPVTRLKALAWLLVPALLGASAYWLMQWLEIAPFWRIAGGLLVYGVLLVGTSTVRVSEIRELVRR